MKHVAGLPVEGNEVGRRPTEAVPVQGSERKHNLYLKDFGLPLPARQCDGLSGASVQRQQQ